MSNISNKVTIPALAGAIVVVLVWLLTAFTKVQMPPEVSAALTVIIMALLGWAVPHGGQNG